MKKSISLIILSCLCVGAWAQEAPVKKTRRQARAAHEIKTDAKDAVKAVKRGDARWTKEEKESLYIGMLPFKTKYQSLKYPPVRLSDSDLEEIVSCVCNKITTNHTHEETKNFASYELNLQDTYMFECIKQKTGFEGKYFMQKCAEGAKKEQDEDKAREKAEYDREYKIGKRSDDATDEYYGTDSKGRTIFKKDDGRKYVKNPKGQKIYVK